MYIEDCVLIISLARSMMRVHLVASTYIVALLIPYSETFTMYIAVFRDTQKSSIEG